MDIWEKACHQGLIGIFIEEKWGGPGFGWTGFALAMEEFWRVNPGLGQVLGSTVFGSEELQLFGSEEQKKKFLPRLVKGDWLISI